MKIRLLAALVLLLSPCIQAQTGRVVSGSTTGPGVSGGSISVGAGKIIYHRELGKWWQSSDIAKKLQLSDGQISQLDQTFYDHKVKLIDFTADMEKQDLKLQSLLDADVPNEGQIESQVDQVLSARGKLEREFTLMNLDLRKVLSLEQWRQLKSIRGQTGTFGDKVFFRKVLPGAGPQTAPLPPEALPMLPPPPPGGGPDEMY